MKDNKKEILEELKELSPLLHGFKLKQSEENLHINPVKKQAKQQSKARGTRWYYITGIAASLMLLLIAQILFNKDAGETLSDEEYLSYIEENLDAFDQDDLFVLFEDREIMDVFDHELTTDEIDLLLHDELDEFTDEELSEIY